ncbi:Oidioi.mRNA.OKI2018_I69.chr2.g7718.t1.cds [Oikopleura dioica]|uniref:Oidioi.mRNA.OKI2018_I69.chr2.g7718.t1.cds n=1 Tax=Oikopleura dioica TaxID=34765 RepID=A0ABN7T7K4_OIKDI|nr:Oidioi.mRNA.OKI2018_I69.chr2.g7718.t1.cds [Oikopleura dioica]
MVQRISARLSKKDPNNGKLTHQRPGQARSRAGANRSRYAKLEDTINNVTKSLESTRIDKESKKAEEPSTDENNRYSLADISVIQETQPEEMNKRKRARKAVKALFDSDDEAPAAAPKSYATRSTKRASPPRSKPKLVISKVLAPDTPEMERKSRVAGRENLPGPRYIPESDEEMT